MPGEPLTASLGRAKENGKCPLRIKLWPNSALPSTAG